jgi:hypothetical protein
VKSNCIGSWRCPGNPKPKASYRNPSKNRRPYSPYLGDLLPDFPLSDKSDNTSPHYLRGNEEMLRNPAEMPLEN